MSRPHARPRALVLAIALGLTGSTVHGQPRPPSPPAPTRPGAPRSAAEEQRRAQVVARINTVTITAGELEDLLNDAPLPIRQSYADPARRRAFLEDLVQTTLLAEEARRRGLERDPQVAGTLRRILSQRVEQVAVLEAITPDSVTDAEVAAYYAAHLSDYQQPEFRRATMIVTADADSANRALADLRRARSDMRRVRELVRQYSVDEDSRSHEGDAFYFQRSGQQAGEGHGVDPALAAAVFALEREMDPTPQPVPMAGGRFAVAVLTGIRPALRRNLADPGVAASIRGFIVRERRTQRAEQLITDLRARLRPEVHAELLDLIRLPPSDLGNLPAFDPHHAH